MAYSAKSTDVYFTMVNGKILYKNNKLTFVEDKNTIKEKAKQIAKRLFQIS